MLFRMYCKSRKDFAANFDGNFQSRFPDAVMVPELLTKAREFCGGALAGAPRPDSGGHCPNLCNRTNYVRM